MNYLLSKMICIQGQDRTLPFTNPRVKRQSGHYTLRAAEGAFRCGKGRPVTTVHQARARQGVSRGRGPPDMEADHARHGTGVSAGAPISAFSRSIQGRFNAGRASSYAASHREEARSAICPRVKSKSCHPLPLLSVLTQEAQLAGNEPIQTGRSSAAKQKTHPAAEQKIGPATGATPSSPLRPQRIRICKAPLQTARGGLLQGDRSAESEKMGTGEHQ